MDDDLDGVVSNIRACIISSKGPVPIRNLIRDYETLVGNSIPFRKFNFATLDKFLQSLPSLHVTGSGRDTMVEAAQDKSSSHITNLISKQKTTTSKKKGSFFPPSRRGPPPSRGYGRARGGYAPRFNYSPRQQSYNSEPDSSRFQRPQSQLSYKEPESSHYSRQKLYDNDENSSPDVDQLIVKVGGNEKRQVSIGDPLNNKQSTNYQKPKYEQPPRFQRAREMAQTSLQTPSFKYSTVNDVSQNVEENLYLDQTNNTDSKLHDFTSSSQEIISPLGPSQLIAAGRAKQKAQLENLSQYEDYWRSKDLPQANKHQALPTLLSRETPKTFRLDRNQGGTTNQRPVLSEIQTVLKADDRDIANNVNLLLQYTLAKGWPAPDYTVFNRKPKGSQNVNGASVKVSINDEVVKKYSGYPFEDQNENVAKGYAAKKALEELLEEDKVKNAKDIINSPTDRNIICTRVCDIIQGLHNGMFANKVEELYVHKYTEGLPEDWIQTIESWPTLSVEATLNSYIILPKDPEKTLLEPVYHEAVATPGYIALDSLTDEVWDVYVTHATATDTVWFRLIGENYSEKYEDLLSNMVFFYNAAGAKELALSIEVGQYYAARSEDGWFRVCVCEVNEETQMVTAWLIDHGDNDKFPFSSLYRLPEEYCALPTQALQCTLDGLETFSEDPIACEVVSTCEHLVGQVLVAQINFKDEDTRVIKATLFDTSGSDDVNVNETIRDIIYTKARPVLPNEGVAVEVFVSSISKKGEIYIQTLGPTYDRINEVLESLGGEEISKHKLTSFKQVELNKMYLAKYSKDDNWYRAVVTATPSVHQYKIGVRFVDFGNAELVTISDIADMEKLPLILKTLPPQALQVALQSLPVESLSGIEIAKLNAMLMDEEKTILIKTVKIEEDPPVVDMFCKSSGDDSLLESVNNTILYLRCSQKEQMFSSHFNSNQPTLNSSTNGHDGFHTYLKRPEINEDFMAISITLAANPGNFIFQPVKYVEDLDKLMKKLQLYYEATTLPVNEDEIVKGNLYAAMHPDDNSWYRVVVTEAVNGSNVAVRLCDYGDVAWVPVSNLRYLEPEFWETPFLGIKGKLAGVMPVHRDWSVEDCVRFQNLVVGPTLAAMVIDVEDSSVNPMDMVVSLHLVNTNSDTDEVISEILVNEHRAVKKKS